MKTIKVHHLPQLINWLSRYSSKMYLLIFFKIQKIYIIDLKHTEDVTENNQHIFFTIILIYAQLILCQVTHFHSFKSQLTWCFRAARIKKRSCFLAKTEALLFFFPFFISWQWLVILSPQWSWLGMCFKSPREQVGGPHMSRDTK